MVSRIQMATKMLNSTSATAAITNAAVYDDPVTNPPAVGPSATPTLLIVREMA